ncbi:MAG: hypothetical protein WCK74_14105 [Gemmatimonadaceae bacterium]
MPTAEVGKLGFWTGMAVELAGLRAFMSRGLGLDLSVDFDERHVPRTRFEVPARLRFGVAGGGDGLAPVGCQPVHEPPG